MYSTAVVARFLKLQPATVNALVRQGKLGSAKNESETRSIFFVGHVLDYMRRFVAGGDLLDEGIVVSALADYRDEADAYQATNRSKARKGRKYGIFDTSMSFAIESKAKSLLSSACEENGTTAADVVRSGVYDYIEAHSPGGES